MTLAAWMFSPLMPMCLDTRRTSQKLSVLWSDITAAVKTSARCPRGDSDGMLFAWQLGARVRRRCVTSNRDVGYLASISTQGYLDGSWVQVERVFRCRPVHRGITDDFDSNTMWDDAEFYFHSKSTLGGCSSLSSLARCQAKVKKLASLTANANQCGTLEPINVLCGNQPYCYHVTATQAPF